MVYNLIPNFYFSFYLPCREVLYIHLLAPTFYFTHPIYYLPLFRSFFNPIPNLNQLIPLLDVTFVTSFLSCEDLHHLYFQTITKACSKEHEQFYAYCLPLLKFKRNFFLKIFFDIKGYISFLFSLFCNHISFSFSFFRHFVVFSQKIIKRNKKAKVMAFKFLHLGASQG